MKRFIYRLIFTTGIMLFLLINYLTFSLSPQEYEQFNKTELSAALFSILGITMIFYAYSIIRSCIDIIFHKRKPMIRWFLLVLLVPAIGSFIYYEKYILPKKQSPDSDNLPSVSELAFDDTVVEAGWQRFVAVIIDIVIVMILIGLYIWSFGVQAADGRYQVRGLEAIFLLSMMWVCFFPLVEFLFGGTIGKRILGLQVAMRNGGKLTLEAAFKRHLLDVIDLLLVFWIIPFPKQGKSPPRRLGDRWAKTIVVKRS